MTYLASSEVLTVTTTRFHAVGDVLLDVESGAQLRIGHQIDRERLMRVLADLLNHDVIALTSIDVDAF